MAGLSILILGAGGVGGYLGARAVEAGADVTFLVRPARKAQLLNEGLRLVSPLGDFSSKVKTVTAGEPMETVDLVVLAPKAFGLQSAIEAVIPAIGENTRIVGFLNGIAHIDILVERFGEARVLGGIAHLPVRLREDGTIEHLAPFASFVVGAVALGLAASETTALAFVAALRHGDVDVRYEPDIHHAMWMKFVFIATLAGATCLMRAPVGDIVDAEGGVGFIVGLLDECREIAAASGVRICDDELAGFRRQLTEPGSVLTASMLRDLEACRPTEWRHILGDLASRGRRFGVPHPNLQVAAMNLEIHELKRARLSEK